MRIPRSLAALLSVLLLVGLLGTSAVSAQPSKPLLRRAIAARAAARTTERYVPDQIVVGLHHDSSLARQSRLQGATALSSRFRSLAIRAVRSVAPDSYLLDIQPGQDVAAAVAQASADPQVRFAEPNYRYDHFRAPNDSLYSFQYAPARIGMLGAWDITTGSNGVVVAVIDTGVNADHPDLQDNLLPGYNFVEGNEEPDDDVFHGTFVSGIIAARGDNGMGVAGLCWQCRILPIRSLGSDGGTLGSIAQGVRYAVDRGARIINMSLGASANSTLLRDAVNYALSKNVLVVAASGNAGEENNEIAYPAAYPGVLSVGATDVNDQIAPFSTNNTNVQISAPGVNVASTGNDQDLYAYGAYDGTSFAAPIVSGVAALMLSVNPSLSAEQLKQILLATAVDLGSPGPDNFFGAGRVDARRAVEAAVPSAFTRMVNPNQAGAVYFDETGHTVRGDFLRFWNDNGGLPVFGFPISEEFEEISAEGTYRVQYFERNRLELHPEKAPPHNVLLGRLGETALLRTGRDWRRFPLGDPSDPECRFFEPTGHTVCGLFLEYYDSHGLNDPALDPAARSLQLFGLPLSEAQEETNSSGDTVIVQHFERARMEFHPELQEESQVLLGLLGNELARPFFGSVATIPPEGPELDRCGGIRASTNGGISPSACVLFGTTVEFTITGFQPGEQIGYWLSTEEGEILGGTETGEDLLTADPNGMLDGLDFPTSLLAPGTFFFVFQGTTSGHKAIVYFRIIDG